MLPRDHSYSYEEYLELQSEPSLAMQRASNQVHCDLLVDPVEGWRYGNSTDSSSCGSVSGESETDCEESGGGGDCEESGGEWEEKSELFVGEEWEEMYRAFQSRRSSSLRREKSGGGREKRTKGLAATNDVRDRDKSNGNATNNTNEEDESSCSEGEEERAQQSAKMNTSVDKSWAKRTKSTTASWTNFYHGAKGRMF
eukprot:g3880.t1